MSRGIGQIRDLMKVQYYAIPSTTSVLLVPSFVYCNVARNPQLCESSYDYRKQIHPPISLDLQYGTFSTLSRLASWHSYAPSPNPLLHRTSWRSFVPSLLPHSPLKPPYFIIEDRPTPRALQTSHIFPRRSTLTRRWFR